MLKRSLKCFSTHRFMIGCYVKKVHWDCPWDVMDDSNLLKGIYEYGMGSWESIKMDTELKLHDKVGVVRRNSLEHFIKKLCFWQCFFFF
jgi:hypothetical protein